MFKFESKPCSEMQCRVYLSQIAKGDENALENLYKGLSYPIFLFAMSYCKNKETAEDIVQDTFVNLIRNISHYNEFGYAKTWIFTISKNLCLDNLARQKPILEIIDTGLETDFSTLEVNEVLESLSDTEKLVVRFNVFAGLKLKEVARVTNLPIGKVRYAHRNAIKKLKLFYSLHNDEGGINK